MISSDAEGADGGKVVLNDLGEQTASFLRSAAERVIYRLAAFLVEDKEIGDVFVAFLFAKMKRRPLIFSKKLSNKEILMDTGAWPSS